VAAEQSLPRAPLLPAREGLAAMPSGDEGPWGAEAWGGDRGALEEVRASRDALPECRRVRLCAVRSLRTVTAEVLWREGTRELAPAAIAQVFLLGGARRPGHDQ
jgi:hypothetical protein